LSAQLIHPKKADRVAKLVEILLPVDGRGVKGYGGEDGMTLGED